MEWIRLKDKLPDPGQRVYLWLADRFHGIPWTWEKQDTENITINGFEISHWMELSEDSSVPDIE